VSAEDLWEMSNQQPIRQLVKERKWLCLDHTIRKPNGDIAKTALHWNSQGVRRQECPRKTWKRIVEEEAIKSGKTWSKFDIHVTVHCVYLLCIQC
jgi:hypothetical protein